MPTAQFICQLETQLLPLYLYILYSLSVFSLAISLQLILEISVTYRFFSYLMADNWLICGLCAMHDFLRAISICALWGFFLSLFASKICIIKQE